jgi:hypothetical protein
MAEIKSFTDIPQSKKLAEFLPSESADVIWDLTNPDLPTIRAIPYEDSDYNNKYLNIIAVWSLAALLKYLSEIKPKVYTPVLFPSEGKWILQFAEYGHGNICEVTCDNPVDACYEMILKLNKIKML